ncbi:MAG: trigger factor [Clostridium sp.]|nr:trigger factor [Clostridium sp.]
MKKKLLCLLTCMSMVLVACSSTKENKVDDAGNTKKEQTKKTEMSSYGKYVELGQYKGMEVEKELGQVEPADLQRKIDEILQSSTTKERIKEGTIKKGDTVNIDYVGKVGGVAFDNGSAKGQSLTIGSGSYIEGFETGLIGAKVGDTVTVNVTFPEEYGVPELNGQDATFDVTINFIEGDPIVPEWNDEFVKNTTQYNSTKEYEDVLRVELENELKETEEYTLQGKILTNLVNECTFKELPEDLVAARSDSMTQYYKDYADKNKLDYSEFIQQQFGMTEDEFNKQVRGTAENSVKQTLAVYAVAEAENLIPTGEEKTKKELEIAQEHGYDSAESLAEIYGEDYAIQLVIRNEVIKFIEDNAKITEVKVTAEDIQKELEAQNNTETE